MFLTMGTPKMVPLILGNPHIVCLQKLAQESKRQQRVFNGNPQDREPPNYYLGFRV